MKNIDSSNHNYAFWQTEARAKKFTRMHGLQAAEQLLFEKLDSESVCGPLIDLGVGCGRTSPFLRLVNRDYVGVDYSSVMINHCKRRFPDFDFRVGDARCLEFESGSVGTVVFSYNGIDCVSHSDRLIVLAEAHRVLKPGGVFVFSSHNRDCPYLSEIRNPWDRRFLPKIGKPSNMARQAYFFFIGIQAHRRLVSGEVETDEYAVLNEQTNRFRELMYYISPTQQERQLQDVGFVDVDAVGASGTRVGKGEFSPDGWVYYWCRKPAAT